MTKLQKTTRRKSHGLFAYGKTGLWERWYTYPPEPDWLPADVYLRVKSVRIKFTTYWFVSKPGPFVHIENKIPLPVVPAVVLQQMLSPKPPFEVPPETEVLTPTELESEDEAEFITETEDEAELIESMSNINIMDLPLLW